MKCADCADVLTCSFCGLPSCASCAKVRTCDGCDQRVCFLCPEVERSGACCSVVAGWLGEMTPVEGRFSDDPCPRACPPDTVQEPPAQPPPPPPPLPNPFQMAAAADDREPDSEALPSLDAAMEWMAQEREREWLHSDEYTAMDPDLAAYDEEGAAALDEVRDATPDLSHLSAA